MIHINPYRINYDEIIKTIASNLRDSFKTLLSKAKFDRTFKATVVGNIKGNKYQVIYKGETYTVTSDVALSTDQVVRVCAPQNNWSELFVVISGSGGSSGGGDVPTGAYVSGVKGEEDTVYRTGQVEITRESLGLENVENKSAKTIISEITSEDITNALGFSPIDTESDEYKSLVSNSHTHENKSILDTITSTLIGNWNSAVTHISDTVKHITSAERIKWNAASSQAHGHDNKNVLDEIASDDLTNWNKPAFGNVTVGETTIASETKGDTFKITAGNHVTIEADEETKEITISAEGEKYEVADSENDGLMSSEDKVKLDTIAEGATKTIVDSELSEESTNPVQNKVILSELNKKERKIIQVTNAEYEAMYNAGTLDEEAYYLTTDDDTNNLIASTTGYFTLAMDGWDLVAYYNENDTPPPISFDPETWNIYYEVDDGTNDGTDGTDGSDETDSETDNSGTDDSGESDVENTENTDNTENTGEGME